MHKPRAMLLLLVCSLVISGCSSVGPDVRPPVCPRLSPAPASLMQEPQTEQRVRAELLQPLPPVTLRSVGSRPSSVQTVPR